MTSTPDPMTSVPNPKRVLVVDDHADIRLMCRVNLAFDGYEVMEAPDGESCLAKVEEFQPDVILLDVMMPTMDGWQVLERLQASPSTSHIPVILLTARVQREDEARGWTNGAAEYLVKPFNPANLAEVVRRTLASDESAAARRRRALHKLSIR